MHYKTFVHLNNLESIESDVEKAVRPFYYENYDDSNGAKDGLWAWDWYEVGGRWSIDKTNIPVSEIANETAVNLIADGKFVNLELEPNSWGKGYKKTKDVLHELGITDLYLVVVDFHS